MKERWRDIYGYEGYYQVSHKGRVRSLNRTVARVSRGKDVPFVRKGRILSPMINRGGYPFVDLFKNKRDSRRIHRLVAEAFIPNPKRLPVVNHKNNNRRDNRVANLEWTTQSENLKHYYQSKK